MISLHYREKLLLGQDRPIVNLKQIALGPYSRITVYILITVGGRGPPKTIFSPNFFAQSNFHEEIAAAAGRCGVLTARGRGPPP